MKKRSFAKCFATSLIALSFHGNLFAKQVTKIEARALLHRTSTLLKIYPDILKTAVKEKELTTLESVVEKDSPWYQVLEHCKKIGDFVMPSAVGEIPYYPLPFLSFFMIEGNLKESQLVVEQNNSDATLYEIRFPSGSVTIRDDAGTLKFYEFNVEALRDYYESQLL